MHVTLGRSCGPKLITGTENREQKNVLEVGKGIVFVFREFYSPLLSIP